MQLTCRSCRARIAAADVNLDKLVAKCRACDAVFGFERELRREPAAELAQGPFREALELPRVRRRPPVPLPVRFRVSDAGGSLALSWRWFSPAKHLFLLFFCAAWDSFLVFWYSALASTGGAPWIAIVFPIAHVAVGVGLTYSVVAGVLNRTTVSIDGRDLKVRHGPIPWMGQKTLPVEQVAQVYCEQRVKKSNNGSSTTYAVSVVAASGQKVELLTGLDEEDQALYVEQAIEDHLRIDDAPVGGELPV